MPLLIWHSVFVTAHKHLLILIIIVSFYIFGCVSIIAVAVHRILFLLSCSLNGLMV